MVFMGGISVRQARSRWTEFTELSKYDQMGSIHPDLGHLAQLATN